MSDGPSRLKHEIVMVGRNNWKPKTTKTKLMAFQDVA